MNISVESSTWIRRNECSEINTESFNYCCDVICFKIGTLPPPIGYPFNNESAPIRRHIERNSAHGACRVRTCTSYFPTVKASGVKFMTTFQFSIWSECGHGS